MTMPDLRISCDVVEFENVKVGEAKLVTIQLYNPTPVPTEWTTLSSESEEDMRSRERKVNEPRSLRKSKNKIKIEQKPLVFEMIPSAGELNSGQKMNVQVKMNHYL